MEQDFLNRFSKFNLSAMEDQGISLEATDVESSYEECKNSLNGKIFGDKVANFSGLKKILLSMWVGCGPIKIKEMGVNLFLFFFSSTADMTRILNGTSWTFDSQFLILRPWSETLDPKKDEFDSVMLWVQVWNMPPHWISKESGFKLKHLFGQVLDVLIPRFSKFGVPQEAGVSAQNVDKGTSIMKEGRHIAIQEFAPVLAQGITQLKDGSMMMRPINTIFFL